MASMKLRVRAATGGQTIRVQIPLLCSLQGLKEVLGPFISLRTTSFSLSLNKHDEIDGPGAALLSSFGVTSGDLLFYIVSPGRSSSPIPSVRNNAPSSRVTASAGDRVPSRASRSLTPPATMEETSTTIGSGSKVVNPEHAPSRGGRAVSAPNIRREMCAAAAARRAATEQRQRTLGSESRIVDSAAAPVVLAPSSPPVKSAERGPKDIETDGRVALPEMLPRGGHHLVPIPDLLHRVLASEIGNISQVSNYLILAVHAVMLETGFIRVESGGTNTSAPSVAAGLEGYKLPTGWGAVDLVNLTYTLPELTRATETSSSSSSSATGRALGEEALLRCLIVGSNAVVVYGAVTGGGVHRVSLSVSKFLRENLKLQSSPQKESWMEERVEHIVSGGSLLGQGPAGEGSDMVDNNLVAASTGKNEEENVFSDIFALWKEVKDCLSLPLLTFMCEKTGLPPPPSLLTLPTELKIKVLDSLPSMALANVSCICSELRFLAGNDELWKQKYREEFGTSVEGAPGGHGWKSAFVREIEDRKRKRNRRRFIAELFPPVSCFGGRDFGDRDLLPPFGYMSPDYYEDVDGLFPQYV